MYLEDTRTSLILSFNKHFLSTQGMRDTEAGNSRRGLNLKLKNNSIFPCFEIYSFLEKKGGAGQTVSQFLWVKFSQCDSLCFTNSLGKDGHTQTLVQKSFSVQIQLFYKCGQLRLSCSVLFSLMQKLQEPTGYSIAQVTQVSFNTSRKWAFQNTVCHRRGHLSINSAFSLWIKSVLADAEFGSRTKKA